MTHGGSSSDKSRRRKVKGRDEGRYSLKTGKGIDGSVEGGKKKRGIREREKRREKAQNPFEEAQQDK